MPVYQNVNGTWRPIGPGAIIMGGSPHQLGQIYVNDNGTWRPVWGLDPFRACVMSINVDDSAYGTINFRTGQLVLYLNNDRRNFTYDSRVGRDNALWNPGLRGKGWEDYHNYVSASVVNPTLQLKPYELARIKSCTAKIVFNGRNTPRITQQPNAGNDWTVVWRVNDPQNGPGGYDIAIDVQTL